MDPFLKVFFSIDGDASGMITIDELQEYVETNNLEESMVTDWQLLFDPQNTGVITLENFCRTLGIAPAEAKMQRDNMVKQNQTAPSAKNGITILHTDVTDSLKEDILKKLMELLSLLESKEEVTFQLKKYLDDKYGRSWVVILTADSFWLQATHVTQSAYCFRTNDISCLIWRTYEED
ncbi:Tegument antigen (I(H)A) [Fasciola hepatica]|uniref:Tegument antigen (I(H)A) n=1 Tax=Fasciola hepatica TaxID=6192 RepID=A0A4E0REX7_FASHE|nr:Tegument antigen (I(H)A) [Fasciola hepatica]